MHLARLTLLVLLLPIAWAESGSGARILFDVAALDGEGLRGPEGGKTSVDYEFCIPDTPEHRRTVRSLDGSIRFLPGSPGRSGCGPGQVLCIGNTRQPDARAVLERLVELPWISDIRECHWE